jgi:hypothetical protein
MWCSCDADEPQAATGGALVTHLRTGAVAKLTGGAWLRIACGCADRLHARAPCMCTRPRIARGCADWIRGSLNACARGHALRVCADIGSMHVRAAVRCECVRTSAPLLFAWQLYGPQAAAVAEVAAVA